MRQDWLPNVWTMDNAWTSVGQVQRSHDGQLALTPERVSVVHDARARQGDRVSPRAGRHPSHVQQSCTSRCERSEVIPSQRVIKP